MLNELFIYKIEFSTLIYLLPLLFIIHDLEEILFIKSSWFKRCEPILKKRFPHLLPKVAAHLERTTTMQFILMVAEEFTMLNLITFHALITGFYYAWIGLFMAFLLHLIVHCLQWIIIRKYIPCIVTTILCLPYSIYGMIRITTSPEFEISPLLFWTASGIVFTFINLLLLHKISNKYIIKNI